MPFSPGRLWYSKPHHLFFSTTYQPSMRSFLSLLVLIASATSFTPAPPPNHGAHASSPSRAAINKRTVDSTESADRSIRDMENLRFERPDDIFEQEFVEPGVYKPQHVRMPRL